MSGRVRLAGAILAGALLAGPAAGEILAPASVDPGEAMRVGIAPPLGGHALLVLEPIAGLAGAEEAGPPVAARPLAPGTQAVEIAAPERAGSYRLRLDGAGRRDSAFFEVVAAPVGLASPSRLPAALPFEVAVAAPVGARLVLAGPGEGPVRAELAIDAETAAAGRVTLDAPRRSGRYALMLLPAGPGTPLERLEIAVDATLSWLRAPLIVRPGASFAVERRGPGGPDHAIAILTEGGGRSLSTRDLAESPGPRGTHRLTAPARVGTYLLRYLSRADGEVLAEAPLFVRD